LGQSVSVFIKIIIYYEVVALKTFVLQVIKLDI